MHVLQPHPTHREELLLSAATDLFAGTKKDIKARRDAGEHKALCTCVKTQSKTTNIRHTHHPSMKKNHPEEKPSDRQKICSEPPIESLNVWKTFELLDHLSIPWTELNQHIRSRASENPAQGNPPGESVRCEMHLRYLYWLSKESTVCHKCIADPLGLRV